MKLLIDENLSPWVAQELCKDGIDACHIRDRGRLGIDDGAVLNLAFGEDRILVTANVDDFVVLAHASELHAGIILIEARSLTRDEQLQVVRKAIAVIGNQGDLINRVLRVAIDGTMSFEDIPPE